MLAVDYLTGKAHTEIGTRAGYVAYPEVFQRVRGFRKAILAHSLPLEDDWNIAAAPPAMDRGHQVALGLLGRCPQITAFLACNDLLAVGAIHTCKELC